MSTPFKSWLAQQINPIDSVQRCTLGSEVDIVVHSWRGILIHIHILDTPLRTRQIKKIAQEATRNGIGTLFIVNAALLPPDGARLSPEEWLMALHALTDGKIYAYRVDNNGPHIFQAHFRVTTKPDERDVWYGGDVPLQKLPFYRVWVKLNAIKGDYLIANFDGAPFWHNTDYRNARAAAFEQSQRAARGSDYGRYSYGYGGNGGPEIVREPETRQTRAYTALGLRLGATCDEVKSAFRRLALEVHPDTSKLEKADAEARFRALTDAYNTIRESIDCR